VEAEIEADLAFKPLEDRILGRLLSRLEDRPLRIKKEFEDYRAAVPWFQAFIDTYDSRKVLQLNAYELPPTMFKVFHFILAPIPIALRQIGR